MLRDLLLSCKLGLFTPNKAGDYLPVKWPIDGGGQWAVCGGPAESGEGGWYRNQALPRRLVIHQQQRLSDLLAGDDLEGERRGAHSEGWGGDPGRKNPQQALLTARCSMPGAG